MFIVVPGQHVSILIESSSGLSKKTNPYLAMFKNALWDITVQFETLLSKNLFS